ncbi:MAG: hypothetical protein ACK561_16465 [Pseudomonadaceae bacterium]
MHAHHNPLAKAYCRAIEAALRWCNLSECLGPLGCTLLAVPHADLKQWMSYRAPDQRPAFFFDVIPIVSVHSITAKSKFIRILLNQLQLSSKFPLLLTHINSSLDRPEAITDKGTSMTDSEMANHSALSREPMVAFCPYGKHHGTVRRLLYYENTSPALLPSRR